ncbi:MAG: O-antigen ligase family protein [Verrucomicrobiales bacterium]|nr:O-antigen ligase family protein [Verrucomicrobiales bacterium]
MKSLSPQAAQPTSPRGAAFAGVFGLVLALGLLKFGNPVILDALVETPRSLAEWRVFAWPLRFAYPLLLVALVAALPLLLLRARLELPPTCLLLVLSWYAWQGVATFTAVDPAVAAPIFLHFTALVVCLLLGAQALSRAEELRTFWLCLAAGLVVVLGLAAEQRFGGLEATRKMIFENAQGLTLAPEYLARIQSNRVFSTLVYPNALAGALLLLLPPTLVLAHRVGGRYGPLGARTLAALAALAGIAVLVWSGSKAGWLLALGMVLVVLAHYPIPRRARLAAGVLVAVVGLASFGWLYAAKLKAGATSVSARYDYWNAAVTGILERPVLGHGPGGFKGVYSRVKRPESEMAQLAHNDYLQQGVDSGLPGFLTYAGFTVAALLRVLRFRRQHSDVLPAAVALGVFGWFAQGMVEFGLYLPATSWIAFALLGWLLAQKPSPAVPSSVTSP